MLPASDRGADANDPHPLADAAEEVRLWLVNARGGAPFLSGSDGDVLAKWLQSGVSVAQLLRAIDETACHRREKKVRRAFTLASIAPKLKRPSATRAAATPGAHPQAEAPLAWPTLAEAPQTPAEACRCFEQLWEQLADRRAELLADARLELGDFAEQLDAETAAALCEEYARERVRSQYPQLRAVCFG